MSPLRGCILGSSHVAALKVGYDQGILGVTLRFFAAMANELADTAVEGGRLVPTTAKVRQQFELYSGGDGVVELSEYDFVAVAGAGPTFRNVATIYNSFRLGEHQFDDHPRRIISPALLRQTVYDRLRGLVWFEVVQRIRPVVQSPILVFPTPCPGEGYLQSEEARRMPPLEAVEAWEALYRVFLEVSGELSAECGAVFVPQPAETMRVPGFARPELNRDPARLRKPSKPDHFHMNGAFGRLAIEAMVAALPAPATQLAGSAPR